MRTAVSFTDAPTYSSVLRVSRLNQNRVDGTFLAGSVGYPRRAETRPYDCPFRDDISPGVVLICRIAFDGRNLTFSGLASRRIGHVRHIASEEAHLPVSAKGAYLL